MKLFIELNDYKNYPNKGDDFKVGNKYYVGQVKTDALKDFIDKGEIRRLSEDCGSVFSVNGYTVNIREMVAKFKVVELCEKNLVDSIIEITEITYTDRNIVKN